MKKWICGLLAMTLLLCMTACGPREKPWSGEVEFSNLAEPRDMALLEKLLADIQEPRRQVLSDHIRQINDLLEPGEPVRGFASHPIGWTGYDPYSLQDRWAEAYPDFLGYNCRITAFSLLQDRIRVEQETEEPDLFLMLDAEALEADDSAFPGREGAFYSLFSPTATENSQDPQVHLRIWQQHWQELGVSFPEDGPSLITVVFHDQIDGDQLTVGHAGVLTEGPDGKLYFLEKVAFQEPYQLCRFESRGELSDYLMTKYDVSYGQPTASPLVLENGDLLEGYRTVPRP